MKGQFFQRIENNKTRFFEIYASKYNKQHIERLKQLDRYNGSDVEKYLTSLGNPTLNDNDVFFLYKLETYYANSNEKDSWTFNESVSCYEQYIFFNFDELLSFVNKKWGLLLNDFVPIYETNIAN